MKQIKNRGNRKLSLEQEKEICKLYLLNNKNGSVALGKKFNVTSNAIRLVLIRNNIQRRSRSECRKSLRLGNEIHNYKGGNISPVGYKRIYIEGKITQEHRHILSQHLGRVLTIKEIVHHRNGNKLDNRLENLEIMTRSEHARHHKNLTKLTSHHKFSPQAK